MNPSASLAPSLFVRGPTGRLFDIRQEQEGEMLETIVAAARTDGNAMSAAAAAVPMASVNNSSHLDACRMSSLVPEASLYAVGQDSYTAEDLFKGLPHNSSNSNRNSGSNNLTFNGKQRPTELINKWPTELMRLMSLNIDDEWRDVIERIQSHPDEITFQGQNGGLNALHAACLRYPPTHVVEALLQARPQAARLQNFNGETPLHLASYSASEEVQHVLLNVAPDMAAVAEQAGDTPLHFAARSGATLHLMERLLQAAPQCISQRNQRGMHPLWLLPRRYLEADDMDTILDENAEEYRDDWDALVLFLKYSYQNNNNNNDDNKKQQQRQEIVINRQDANRDHYQWVVHAAAATPSCPREVLAFLCRMYPEQALVFNEQGYTPLLLAVQTQEMDEPEAFAWDENEDGFREHVDAAEGELQNSQDEVAEEDVALPEGDSDFIAQAVQGRVVVSTSSSSATNDDDAAAAAADDDDDNDAQESEEHKPTAVDILLEWSPRSACVADAFSQRLPLAHALLSGQSWKTVKSLIAVFPRAINTRDPLARACAKGDSGGLYMFQLAAMASPDLDSVYMIARSLPQLVESGRSCFSRHPKEEDGQKLLKTA